MNCHRCLIVRFFYIDDRLKSTGVYIVQYKPKEVAKNSSKALNLTKPSRNENKPFSPFVGLWKWRKVNQRCHWDWYSHIYYHIIYILNPILKRKNHNIEQNVPFERDLHTDTSKNTFAIFTDKLFLNDTFKHESSNRSVQSLWSRWVDTWTPTVR